MKLNSITEMMVTKVFILCFMKLSWFIHHEAQQHHWNDGKPGFYFVLPEIIIIKKEKRKLQIFYLGAE